jgi:glycerol-3-phosphate cytidylyltransferase
MVLIKDGMTLTVGFTCSAFDLCHAGHISMLQEAKHQCDWLIVGLQTDPTIDRPTKNKPTQSIVERYIQIEAVKYVDQVIPYATEKDLEDLLLMLPIDVRILGAEYQDKEFTGKTICIKRNIKLFFNSRQHSFSSTSLRKRIYQIERERDTSHGHPENTVSETPVLDAIKASDGPCVPPELAASFN